MVLVRRGCGPDGCEHGLGAVRRHAAYREPHQLRRSVHDPSLVIVPVVSLFTPAVPFQIKPPTPESAIDREYDRELAQEELEAPR